MNRLILCLTLALPALAQEPRRPNVLLIVADDQGYADLSCAGLADDVATPNLDRLAARGVRYTSAYAASPICNLSRMALMTGVYPLRFGSRWYGGKGLHEAGHPTLGELFSAAGYATGYVGKFHYGSNHKPTHRSFPTNHGFTEFFGCSGGRKHYLIHSAAAESAFRASRREHERRGQSLRMEGLWEGEEQRDVEGFSTELFGERARAFLRAHREEPFLLVLAFNAVHNFTHQLPAEYLEQHGLEGYRDWDPTREAYYDWYRQGRAPNNPEGRAHFLGQLHYLDLELGRVLDELDALELTDDTLVAYIGDNGGSTPIYADNGPLRGSKYTLYEGGLRVPLVLSWPGRWERGVVRADVVSGMDLLPTFATAAGIALPEVLDGQDLGPALRGEESVGHSLLCWDTGHERALLSGELKLHEVDSKDHADYEMVELEVGTFLHDLSEDLGERVNLAAERPGVVTALREAHAGWRARMTEDG